MNTIQGGTWLITNSFPISTGHAYWDNDMNSITENIKLLMI